MTRHADSRASARVVEQKLRPPRYPRSAAYDPVWVLENLMGPNVLWLTEALLEAIDLRPGMRVLDLGCGKAVSSIFLARELGVQVWAADLWVPPGENWSRIRAAGLEDAVFPLHVEAHALPFADGFFDAVMSIDAYHYFGTDDLFLDLHLARLVEPGGTLAIVVPGLTAEFETDPPSHLARHWAERRDLWSFHSPEWWRSHWERTGPVAVRVADTIPEGWRDWIAWDEASLELGYVQEQFAEFVPDWIEAMRIDAGRNLGFTRLVAERSA